MSRYQLLTREIFEAIRDVEYALASREAEEFSIETIEEIKNAGVFLKKAQIYMDRVGELMTGYDNEDTFHKRLKQQLKDI